MAKAQYTEEQFKDFGDFYAYTDVFDWHYVNILQWKNGVALVELENGRAIFNGHNNKGYFFDEGKVPEDWITDQFEKCAAKYACAPAVAKMIEDEAFKHLEEIREAKRRADYYEVEINGRKIAHVDSAVNRCYERKRE